MADKQPCPMCGGFGDEIDQHSELELKPDLDAASPLNNESGNEDQDAARKSRLDGVMADIRKRHMGR